MFAFVPLIFSQNQSTQQATGTQSAPPVTKAASQLKAGASADSLVLELPNDQCWEGLLEYVTISLDGNWALVNRAGFESGVQLYSLKTGQRDRLTLTADLNRLDNAAFCDPHGIARVGEHVGTRLVFAERRWMPATRDV